MNLVIDIGNTKAKAAIFQRDSLLKTISFPIKLLVSEIKKLQKEFPITKGMLSSVAFISSNEIVKLQSILPFEILSSKTKLPFKNLYKTPKTLGVDRVALVAYGVKKYPSKDVLLIDAGTCITFDFVNAKKEYLGGAISPGIEMRYKALHTFTSNLPLLEKESTQNEIGNTTNESIHIGVIRGVLQEIEGIIRQYQKKYPNLTIVLTGGDHNFLAKQLKSSIFATSNFLLYGLNELLKLNTYE